MSIDLYNTNCLNCSRITTLNYSTSFSLGIRMLHKRFRGPVYAIYGYVRYADEIVDTFFGTPQAEILEEFTLETQRALDRKFSSNPIHHSFQKVVHEYGIDGELIDAFLRSMAFDLHKTRYDREGYQEYIYGSAEVVGLMCLRVFCEGNDSLYQSLLPQARKLGEAFQKVNFLRDMRSDYKERGRLYFPGIDICHFRTEHKQSFEDEIAADFRSALEGIRRLPPDSRFGVYLAYTYYLSLLKRIQRTPAKKLIKTRVRVPDRVKFWIMITAWVRNKLNLL